MEMNITTCLFRNLEFEIVVAMKSQFQINSLQGTKQSPKNGFKSYLDETCQDASCVLPRLVVDLRG